MTTNGLLLSRKPLLFISLLGFAVILLGAMFKITHMSYFGISANVLIVFGTMFSFISWISVLIDVIKNKPQNWIHWLGFLIIFGNISAIIYLFRKKT